MSSISTSQHAFFVGGYGLENAYTTTPGTVDAAETLRSCSEMPQPYPQQCAVLTYITPFFTLLPAILHQVEQYNLHGQPARLGAGTWVEVVYSAASQHLQPHGVHRLGSYQDPVHPTGL
jgi:hypothetical protein